MTIGPLVHRSARGDAGSATVLVLGSLSVVLLMGTAGTSFVSGVAVRHSAQRTADVIAVAAASAIGGTEVPCAVASRLAEANRVRLVACASDVGATGRTGSVRIVITQSARFAVVGEHAVSAHARAGRLPP